MLFTLEFPIVDLRSFVDAETGVLNRPFWPTPLIDQDFVRSFGMVRRRWRGGLSGWIGEHAVCDARRALRFESVQPLLVTTALGLVGIHFKVVFRRFYFDGQVMAKFDVGLATAPQGVLTQHTELPEKLVRHILKLPVAVPDGNAPVRKPLIDSGKPLADLYEKSSTYTHAAVPERANWWVQAGSPILLIEHALAESAQVPFWGQSVRLSRYPDAQISHHLVRMDGRNLRLWLVNENTLPRTEQRNLRIILLRLHSEKECLQRVLAKIASGHLDISPRSQRSDSLQDYLNQATRRILRLQTKTGDITEDVLDGADLGLGFEAEDLISTGERQALMTALERIGVRRNISLKVEQFVDAAQGRTVAILRQARAREVENLAQLRLQRAQVGDVVAPLQLLNSISETERRIRDLEGQIDAMMTA